MSSSSPRRFKRSCQTMSVPQFTRGTLRAVGTTLTKLRRAMLIMNSTLQRTRNMFERFFPGSFIRQGESRFDKASPSHKSLAYKKWSYAASREFCSVLMWPEHAYSCHHLGCCKQRGGNMLLQCINTVCRHSVCTTLPQKALRHVTQHCRISGWTLLISQITHLRTAKWTSRKVIRKSHNKLCSLHFREPHQKKV